MPRYAFIVYTNPVPGRDQEYNDWYTGRHLDDLLAIPGVVSAALMTDGSAVLWQAI